MRFQVPQFIEVEDKIFGPLTFKQFIFLAGGVGIAVVMFTFLPKFLAFLLGAPIALFGAALAFYKVNDKPLTYFIEAFFKYSTTNKLYIWKKEEKKITDASSQTNQTAPVTQVYIPKLSESKLKDLTWSLDIKENRNPITEERENNV